MPNKFEVELAEGVAKKVSENPNVRAAAQAAGQFLEECFPAAAAKVEKLAKSEIVRDVLHLGTPAERAGRAAVTETAAAKDALSPLKKTAAKPTSSFELPGELGSARPNDTHDDLLAAMSEPRRAEKAVATRARAGADTSNTTPFTLPGEFGSQQEHNETYANLYAAMSEPRRGVPKGDFGAVKKAARAKATAKSIPFDLPGSPGYEGPESILP